ncbi:MAG: serine/threonine protein kinase [Planctomycetes bacterium]|nr:serine/threonine protein kinase [Planctomycetota bacterium]
MASSRDTIKDPVVLLALEKGIVSDEQVAEARKLQAEARKAGRRRDLMRFLVESGALSREQAHQLQQSEANSWKGRQLGDFKILSVLGQGGMGAVFRANQVTMDREIALKILTPTLAGDKVFRERFLREARAVAKLNHPNIVAGIDVGEADGVYFFAMEFIDGDSLGQRLKRKGKLPEKEALEYIRQTALALDHAHKNGLLHRDVKPDNVLIGKDNVAKLADLGLARVGYDRNDDGDKDSKVVDHDDPGLTRQGQTVGTPFYISPEQATGESDLTPGTDLYSLGATLFHLLTGRYPYEGSSGGSIMMKHVRSPVPDPRKADKGVSEHAASVCVKLMQKDPKKRYLDARTLAEDLQRVLDGKKPLLKGKVELSDSSTYGLPAPRPKSEKGARLGITPPPSPSPATPPGPATVGVSAGSSVRPARVKRARETDNSGGLLVGGVAVGACVLIALVLMAGGSGGSPTPHERTTDQASELPKGPHPTNTPSVRPKETKTAETTAETAAKTEAPAPAGPIPPVDTNPVPPDWQPTARGPEPADSAKDKAKREAEEAIARAKVEAEREGSFLEQFDRRLRSGEVSAAESVLKDYESKTAAVSVQYAQRAVNALKEIEEVWNNNRKVMVGKRIQMGDLNGMITSVEFDSFYIEFEKGMSTPKKWADTLVSQRLNAMDYPENAPEKLAARALYLYYRSDEAVLAATTMLKAQADGVLKLPEAVHARCRTTYLGDQRLKATALIGKIKDFISAKVWNKVDELCAEFEEKYGADFADLKDEVNELKAQVAAIRPAVPPSGLAGGPTPEPPKPPAGPTPVTPTPAGPVQPPEVAKPADPPPPVDPTSLEALFSGKFKQIKDAPEHVMLGYDLTKPEQLNDWVQTSGSWELKDGKLTTGGGKGEAIITHKARFKWERTVSITATITFEETKDAAGYYFRDGTGSASNFVQMFIGGLSPADGNNNNIVKKNVAQNCGMVLTFSGVQDTNSNSRSWGYEAGKPYKSSLSYDRTVNGSFWTGQVYITPNSPKRVDRRKISDMKNSDWAGHPAIFSAGTQITVTEILIEGYLDPAWVASAQKK